MSDFQTDGIVHPRTFHLKLNLPLRTKLSSSFQGIFASSLSGERTPESYTIRRFDSAVPLDQITADSYTSVM